MISLAQMRQSNGCGNVKNDVIFNLHLGSGAGSWVSIPCLLQDTTQKHLLHPPKESKETKNPEKRSNFCQVLLCCVGLRTQNPGLREVDLEPSPKRGTGKINRLRQRRKKQHNTSRIVHPVLSNETLALRELDLEPSAKRKTNRTEALANLYW